MEIRLIKKSKFTVYCLVLICVLFQNAPISGQEAKKNEFEQRLQEWREIIVELQLLRQEYYLSDTLESSNVIREKYAAAKKAGDQKIRDLKLAAGNVFRKTAKKGSEYHAFLMNALMLDLEQAEDHTMAYELAKALDSQPISRPDLARRVGVSYFMHSEFDKAEKLLKTAVAANEEGMDAYKFRLQLIPRLKPLWEKELKQREEDKKTKLPRAVFETTKGKFVIELYENNSPNTVKNFVNLAKQGFYNDMDFFYVLPFQFATSGSPNSNFRGSPGYVIKNEGRDREKRRGNFRGSICTPARDDGGANLASSIFMITFGPYSEANTDKYCNFGRVIEGMDVVDALNRSKGMDGEDIEGFKPDKIKTVTVENLRDHEYKPEIIRLTAQ